MTAIIRCLALTAFLAWGAALPSLAADGACAAKLNQAFCCSALGLKYVKVSEVIKEGNESATVLVLANALGKSNREIVELLRRYLREKGDRKVQFAFAYLCK
ncbi:MAG: hypothetical protein K9K66_04180 [Desulfarculaceae bacterium]|nr:hypothetical protein [Desulfarculaceae bacterium]MCF8073240.1 hypothetical protein [Desulfarculaceae bacterium]MCF8100836.1 hypothetical protein [Desulfarculaceae bacterium]